MINEFRDEYYFLSNFYPCKVKIYYDNIHPAVTFYSSEAAFQASKARSFEEFQSFATLDASSAKKKGRHIQLRPDWEEIKDDIMYNIVFQKFIQNSILQKRLVDTGNKYLEEGNTWNDTYWGVCKGKGLNKLGQILMSVRKFILNEGFYGSI